MTWQGALIVFGGLVFMLLPPFLGYLLWKLIEHDMKGKDK